jgi:hypothetical protein
MAAAHFRENMEWRLISENLRNWDKTCSNATSPTKNLTWSHTGLNSRLRGKKAMRKYWFHFNDDFIKFQYMIYNRSIIV